MDDRYFTLITGASSGLGKALAEELAARKYNLILHSLPEQGLADFSNELRINHKIEVLHYETDLTTNDGPSSLYEFVRKNLCNVNMLINNAGIGYDGPIENYTRQQIDQMILLNIRALTLLTYFFTPDLKKNSKSYILNISSLGCYHPTAFKSVYLASKAYIFNFTRALDSEFKGTSVRTCILAPGAIRTNKFVLDRIKRSGWFGNYSALDPSEVAATGIKGMLKGRKVMIPGKFNCFIFSIGLFVPEGIIVFITRRIFRK